MATSSLSDDLEEKKFICPSEEELNKLFSNRYKSTDEEYNFYCNERKEIPPPAVSNWGWKPKRSFDWTKHNKPENRRGEQRYFNDRHHSQDRRSYNRYTSDSHRHDNRARKHRSRSRSPNKS